MNAARIAKAHFDLLRVHVHVDAARIELEPQHVRRHPVVMQHVAIRLAKRVRQDTIAHEAAVDERVLRAAALGGESRTHRESGQTHAARFGVNERRVQYESVGQ